MWKMSPSGTQSFGPSIKKNTSVSSRKTGDQAHSFYRRQILAVGEPTREFDLLAATPRGWIGKLVQVHRQRSVKKALINDCRSLKAPGADGGGLTERGTGSADSRL